MCIVQHTKYDHCNRWIVRFMSATQDQVLALCGVAPGSHFAYEMRSGKHSEYTYARVTAFN